MIARQIRPTESSWSEAELAPKGSRKETRVSIAHGFRYFGHAHSSVLDQLPALRKSELHLIAMRRHTDGYLELSGKMKRGQPEPSRKTLE